MIIYKCKKLNCLKQVFKVDAAYITQLKQKNKKGALTFAAHYHIINVLLSTSTCMMFAVVVWCTLCRR